jgi:long-chain acyl-CoA synthetase
MSEQRVSPEGELSSPGICLRRVLILGFPLLFGQIMRYLHQIADSAMLGHFGDGSAELAAVGIAGLFTWILNTFLWPLSQGVQAITARRYGRQDHENEASRFFTGEAFDNAVVTALYAAVVAMGVSLLARPILSLLIQTEEILELALQYIAMVRISLLPAGVFFVVQGFFGAINRTRYIMWSGIISNGVNIALNYVLIFGMFGFPAMGIRGAALGTALSIIIAFVYLLVILFRRGYVKQYRLFTFRHLRGRLQRDIINVAINPGVQNIIALAIFLVYQTIIEDYSPVLLAATHTAFSYFRLNKTVIGGFARSAGILTGNALGRGDREGALCATRASGMVAAAVAVAVALLTLLLRRVIGGFFSSDPATIEAIARALLFFIPFFFIEALGYAFEMVFISNGYGRWVLFSEFFNNVLFILLATLLVRYLFPETIVYAWLTFGLYQIGHASLMIIGYVRRRWLDVEVDSEGSGPESRLWRRRGGRGEDMSNTVLGLLHDAAARHPERAYLKAKADDGWNAVSFSRAETRSDELAAALLSGGIQAGDRAVILSEGRPEWILAELGLLKARGVAVPLSIQLVPEEISFRVNHSGSSLIFTSRNLLPKVLEAWPDLEVKPRLILFDMPGDSATAGLSELGLTQGEHWVGYSELEDSGRRRLAEEADAVAKMESAIDPEDVVTICYTSGTTGDPKGIMLTHRNYRANVIAATDQADIPDGSYETLVILPLDHSFAHTVAIYAGLYRAVTLWFVDARGGSSSILRNIPINLKEAQPHFLLTVPALSGNFMKKIREGVAAKEGIIARLFESGLRAGALIIGDGYHKPSPAIRLRYGLIYRIASGIVFPKVREQVFGPNIRFCVGGGAILEVKQQEFYAALGMPVYQGYGLTEATPVISSNTPSRHKFGTSGGLLPNVECRIMTDAQNEAKPGEQGEIVIRGDNVMKGYFRNPEATGKTIRDGWLWTGDLGYMDPDGFLMVVGREKALLISPNGEKYPPEEIEEAVLNATDLIDQIMAYCDHRNFTTALITLEKSRCEQEFRRLGIRSPESALALIEENFLRFTREEYRSKTIPPQWAPRVFEIIPESFSIANGMVNSTMKLVRRRVCEAYAGRIEAMYEDNQNQNDRNLEALRSIFGME